MALCKKLCCYLLLLTASWSLPADAGDPGISVVPSHDQTVAITSDENVTYECMVDGGRSVFWQVQNNPLEGDLISEFESIGIYKQDSPQGNSSVLIVSQMGRETYHNTGQNIEIQCRAFQQSPPLSGFSVVFNIITYDRPETPGNLMLTASDGNITLSWSHPQNIPQSVSVSYLVEINSTMRSNVTYEPVRTSGTTVVIQEDVPELEGCETFEFFVTASNDAGDSDPARIEETIPISPDVTSTSSSLSIDAVQIVNQSVSIVVSFKPANTCSENFPVSNYSVNLVGFGQIIFNSSTPSSGRRISAELTSSLVSGLVPDLMYAISVTACNEISCHESEAREVYTTDVQNATVTFFGTRIYLTCTFANRTSAMGCIIKFTLSSNRTEQFNITRTEAQLCSMTANQMIAYDRVEVVDWEAGGTVGTLSIRVQPLEAVDEQSFTMSCPLPDQPLLSAGAIAGIVLGVLLVIAVVVGISATIIVPVVVTRKKEADRDEKYEHVPLKEDEEPSSDLELIDFAKQKRTQPDSDEQQKDFAKQDSDKQQKDLTKKCFVLSGSDPKRLQPMVNKKYIRMCEDDVKCSRKSVKGQTEYTEYTLQIKDGCFIHQ